MAKFKGAVLSCKECGSEFKVPPSRAATAEYCSVACASVGRGMKQRKRTLQNCVRCGKEFETHQCHASRRLYCSYECKHEAPEYRARISEKTSGSSNPMWRGGIVDHSEGYVCAWTPDHPFQSNGYVLAHRLVMEKWLRENAPSSPYLIELGTTRYLSPNFVVHHRDENKRNNSIANLECMTPAEHRRHHNSLRQQKG